MPAPNPGPPPEMPPHGSSDPESPNYNPERAAWEERIGRDEAERIKKAWQAWAAAEDDYIRDQIMFEGKDIGEVETPWNPTEKYQDVHEKGQAAYRRWKPEQERLWKEGIERLRGHFTWDDSIGAYRSGGGGGNSEDFRDAMGRRIAAPANANRAVAAVTSGIGPFSPTYTPQPTPTDPNLRPFLKMPSNNYYRGYGSLWNASSSPARKRPVASNDPYAELRIGGVSERNSAENLFRRQQYYIPGLSSSYGY